jgi:deoxyribose-phosphate aldolase
MEAGADEVDMMHNLAALKNNDWATLERGLSACIAPVHNAGKIIKVIVESGMLSDDELIRCCSLYSEYNIDYMKTSTGFGDTGATLHAVKLMRRHLSGDINIKASGGIRTYAVAKKFIDAGAARIGCSTSMQIIAETVKEEA